MRQDAHTRRLALLLAASMLLLVTLACGGSGRSSSTAYAGSGSDCRYAASVRSTLASMFAVIEKASNHVASNALLQADSAEIADITREFEAMSPPAGASQLRSRAVAMLAAGSGVLENITEDTTAHFLTQSDALKAALSDYETANGCR